MTYGQSVTSVKCSFRLYGQFSPDKTMDHISNIHSNNETESNLCVPFAVLGSDPALDYWPSSCC